MRSGLKREAKEFWLMVPTPPTTTINVLNVILGVISIFGAIVIFVLYIPDFF
jgi:hypothetical protein